MVKQHLNDDGVMVVNMNMRSAQEGNISQYLSDTIAQVFSDVYTVDVSGSTNRELFAGNKDLISTFHTNTNLEKNTELQTLMSRVGSHLEQYHGGNYVMTDDKAPVELLGMKVIDSLIGNEVEYYKNIYDKEGIKGLIEALQ